MVKEHDEVTSPKGYSQNKLEPIHLIEVFKLPFHLGNAVKYICRRDLKLDALTDLKKAIWYITRYVYIHFGVVVTYTEDDIKKEIDDEVLDIPLTGYPVGQRKASKK